MNLINHEVFGDGYFFLDKENHLMLIEEQYKKFAKKLNKRGYNDISRDQLDDISIKFLKRFEQSLKNTFIDYNGKIITNILYLYYKEGFCHYKTFSRGIIETGTISGNIHVSHSSQKVDKYPTIIKVDYFAFGQFVTNSKEIYDKDLIELYKMYGEKDANN